MGKLFNFRSNPKTLLLAMRDVTEAQGGIGQSAKKTAISRQHLYEILAGKHNPGLDNWLSVISGLGFRIRLGRQDAPVELATSSLDK